MAQGNDLGKLFTSRTTKMLKARLNIYFKNYRLNKQMLCFTTVQLRHKMKCLSLHNCDGIEHSSDGKKMIRLSLAFPLLIQEITSKYFRTSNSLGN